VKDHPEPLPFDPVDLTRKVEALLDAKSDDDLCQAADVLELAGLKRAARMIHQVNPSTAADIMQALDRLFQVRAQMEFDALSGSDTKAWIDGVERLNSASGNPERWSVEANSFWPKTIAELFSANMHLVVGLGGLSLWSRQPADGVIRVARRHLARAQCELKNAPYPAHYAKVAAYLGLIHVARFEATLRRREAQCARRYLLSALAIYRKDMLPLDHLRVGLNLAHLDVTAFAAFGSKSDADEAETVVSPNVV